LPKVGKYWKGQGRHKLAAVAARLGVKAEGDLHRAAADCRLTIGVLEALLELEAVPDDADELAALVAAEYPAQRAELDAYWSRRRGGA